MHIVVSSMGFPLSVSVICPISHFRHAAGMNGGMILVRLQFLHVILFNNMKFLLLHPFLFFLSVPQELSVAEFLAMVPAKVANWRLPQSHALILHPATPGSPVKVTPKGTQWWSAPLTDEAGGLINSSLWGANTNLRSKLQGTEGLLRISGCTARRWGEGKVDLDVSGAECKVERLAARTPPAKTAASLVGLPDGDLVPMLEDSVNWDPATGMLQVGSARVVAILGETALPVIGSVFAALQNGAFVRFTNVNYIRGQVVVANYSDVAVLPK